MWVAVYTPSSVFGMAPPRLITLCRRMLICGAAVESEINVVGQEPVI